MSVLAQFIRGLTPSEFGKLESWESGILDLESIGGGEAALAAASEAAGPLAAAFTAKEMLKEAIRKRARGHPDFSPIPGSAQAGPGPVLIDIPEFKEPDPDVGARRRTRTGPPTFTISDPQPPSVPEVRLDLPPLEDVDITRVAPGSRPEPAEPQPSLGDRARAAGATAAGAVGAAAGAAAASAADRAGAAAAAARANPRNVAGIAAVGAGGITAIISGVVSAGGVVKGVLEDGTVVARLPGDTEDRQIKSEGLSPASQFSPVGTGGVPPQGMTGMGPARRYRTPRHGRWSYVPFVIAAYGAASQTGVGPANSGLTAARALAASQQSAAPSRQGRHIPIN